MKHIGIILLFSLGISYFIKDSTALYLSPSNSDGWDRLKEKFVQDNSATGGGSVIEGPPRGSRVKRWARTIPFWKSFFMNFWKAVMRASVHHFYRNWKPVPFVPVKPYRRMPPTTPHPEDVGTVGPSGAPHPPPAHPPAGGAPPGGTPVPNAAPGPTGKPS